MSLINAVVERRILVVEDDSQLLGGITEYLRTHAFHVFATRDREEAIYLINSEWPNAVLSDLYLSVGTRPDGLEIAFEAWKHAIPAALMTGYSTVNVRSDSRLQRILTLIEKPVSLATLGEVAEQMLANAPGKLELPTNQDYLGLLRQFAPWMVTARDER